MSPADRPTARDAPGTSCWGGKVELTGAKGAVDRARWAWAAAARKAAATGADRPPTAIGMARGRAWRAARERRLVWVGGSTGWPRIDSIGVARTTWPP